MNTDKTIPSNNAEILLIYKTEKKAKIIGICMFLNESQWQCAISLMYSILKYLFNTADDS
jgi:hypothetical protein